MLLFPLAAATGAALGMRRGGRLGNVVDLGLRAPLLVWSAVAVQLWLGVTGTMAWPFGGRFVILLVTYLAVGAWLGVNAVASPALRLAFALLAAGWLLNLAAIVPNGGMPVSRSAMAASGIPAQTVVEEGHLGKHVAATPSTTLAWLGDVIPAPALDSVLSVGDLVMSAGFGVGVARAVQPARDPSAPEEDAEVS